MGNSENRTKPLDLLKRQTRKLAPVQAYSRLYYDKKLKAITDARWEQYITEKPEMQVKKGERLRHRNEVIKELLAAETDEVKAEVEQRREEGIDSDDERDVESEDDGEDISPEEKQRRAKALSFQRQASVLIC
jgi:hypothetical protein